MRDVEVWRRRGSTGGSSLIMSLVVNYITQVSQSSEWWVYGPEMGHHGDEWHVFYVMVETTEVQTGPVVGVW